MCFFPHGQYYLSVRSSLLILEFVEMNYCLSALCIAPVIPPVFICVFIKCFAGERGILPRHKTNNLAKSYFWKLRTVSRVGGQQWIDWARSKIFVFFNNQTDDIQSLKLREIKWNKGKLNILFVTPSCNHHRNTLWAVRVNYEVVQYLKYSHPCKVVVGSAILMVTFL